MRCRSLLIVPVVFHAVAAFGLITVSGCGHDPIGDLFPAPSPTTTPTTTPTGPPTTPTTTPTTTSPPPPPVAPPLFNPVDYPDETLARKALQYLGSPEVGGARNCNECHALVRQSLRSWRTLSDDSRATCLTDLQVSTPESARSMISCLKANPDQATSPFLASKLGIYSAAAQLPWFEFTFKQAYGERWEAELSGFKDRIGMPQGDHPSFTQAQFDVIVEWFARGLPLLDETLPEDPPLSTCAGAISAGVAPYVAETRLSGWSAVNAENGILMHGCAGAAGPLECLSTYPRASGRPYGAGWESLAGAKLRILRENPYPSYYWTRSSADGRFVAHGGGAFGAGATILDLQEDRAIPADAFYDPGFFPDNSAFLFQGGSGASVCEQSVLTASPAHVTFREAGCSSTTEVGLYQHVGASLGGGDYWAVESEWSGDPGDIPTFNDPPSLFSASGNTRLTPMIHTGRQFVPGTPVHVPSPFEGDAVISPSGRLLINRVAGPDSRQLGYVLRRLIATPGPAGYTVETPEIARYCVSGAKPAFSYNERWLVRHHYVGDADAASLGFTGPGDPAFAAYRARGASNVYLLDLLTGRQTRVTTMQPGQYALYPHFRSDGWIYFLVRAEGAGVEYVVASDASLVLESAL